MIAPLNDESTCEAERVLSELLVELQREAGWRRGQRGRAGRGARPPLRGPGVQPHRSRALLARGRAFAPTARGVASAFEEEYEKIFGHRMQEGIEIVAVRGTLRTSMPERVKAPEPNGARAV